MVDMQYGVFLADCPARTTLEVIGGSWSPVVITALGERRRRYTELLDRVGGISRKVLTQVRRRLEHDGLVMRTASLSTPRVAHYRLTALDELNPTTKPLSHTNILPEHQQTADRHAAKSAGHLVPMADQDVTSHAPH
jgi:DNA-binding HxlR family transcriptional regulator